MNKKTIITILLALVTMTGQAQKKTAEVKADSLLLSYYPILQIIVHKNPLNYFEPTVS